MEYFFRGEWPTVWVQIIADLMRPKRIHEPKYSERDEGEKKRIEEKRIKSKKHIEKKNAYQSQSVG